MRSTSSPRFSAPRTQANPIVAGFGANGGSSASPYSHAARCSAWACSRAADPAAAHAASSVSSSCGEIAISASTGQAVTHAPQYAQLCRSMRGPEAASLPMDSYSLAPQVPASTRAAPWASVSAGRATGVQVALGKAASARQHRQWRPVDNPLRNIYNVRHGASPLLARFRNAVARALRRVVLHVVQNLLTRVQARLRVDALDMRMRCAGADEELFGNALLRES